MTSLSPTGQGLGADTSRLRRVSGVGVPKSPSHSRAGRPPLGPEPRPGPGLIGPTGTSGISGPGGERTGLTAPPSTTALPPTLSPPRPPLSRVPPPVIPPHLEVVTAEVDAADEGQHPGGRHGCGEPGGTRHRPTASLRPALTLIGGGAEERCVVIGCAASCGRAGALARAARPPRWERRGKRRGVGGCGGVPVWGARGGRHSRGEEEVTLDSARPSAVFAVLPLSALGSSVKGAVCMPASIRSTGAAPSSRSHLPALSIGGDCVTAGRGGRNLIGVTLGPARRHHRSR